MEKQQSENVLQQKEKHQRNAADLLVECLQEEGVEYIFGIPGEENLAVMNAIDQSPIRFITTRHEQGAAFMADVYGRLTGKAGVCLATLGPGATNLVTGVADADGDGAPLVAITGQVGTERMHITGHQFLDLTKMFEPITKRTKMVVRPDTVGEIVRLAFKYAESEKPGATHIECSENAGSGRRKATSQKDRTEGIRGAGYRAGCGRYDLPGKESGDPGWKRRSKRTCIKGTDRVCHKAEDSSHQYHDGKGRDPV